MGDLHNVLGSAGQPLAERYPWPLGSTHLTSTHALLAFIVTLCHFERMSAPALAIDAPHPLSSAELFEFWQERCEGFLAWQRDNFVTREPSLKELAEHKKRLNVLVRFTLHVYAQAADPDDPMPNALRTIWGRLEQLQEWGAIIHNRMSDEEANAVLARVFPDEARTGSSA